MARRRNFGTRNHGGENPVTPPLRVYSAPADPAETGELEPETSLGWKSVRPAKVERARKLIRDRDYPQPEVLDAVANLLAGAMTPRDQER